MRFIEAVVLVGFAVGNENEEGSSGDRQHDEGGECDHDHVGATLTAWRVVHG